ncbi:hypothetical protein D3C74_324620 [compost metagenome]
MHCRQKTTAAPPPEWQAVHSQTLTSCPAFPAHSAPYFPACYALCHALCLVLCYAAYYAVWYAGWYAVWHAGCYAPCYVRCHTFPRYRYCFCCYCVSRKSRCLLNALFCRNVDQKSLLTDRKPCRRLCSYQYREPSQCHLYA